MTDAQASPQRVTANRPRRSSISASPLRQATRSPFSTLKALRRQKSKTATDENNNLVNLFEDITNESELRSPVKISSPSKGAQTGRKSGGLGLFPSSPIRRNVNATPTMLNEDNKRKALTSLAGPRNHQEVYKKPNKLPRSSVPATAPAGDRRTKRFDLSDWQLELPAVSRPPMGSSPLPSTASFSTFPRSPSTFSASRPSDFQAGLAAASKDRSFRPSPSPYLEDDDDDEDSPFRVPSVRRSPSDSLASPGPFGSQRNTFASASTAPAANRGKISRDLTVADLTAFNPSASSPSSFNTRPSALPQPVWRKHQSAAPESPPAQTSLRKPRSRLFASHPSSSAPSPARSPEEGRRTRPRTNSDATAGALYLESLDEDTINASFASRDPIFANDEPEGEEADSPFVAATPRRSRAISVATTAGHEEPITQPQFAYPAVQPRRATSVDNLFGTSASSSNVFGLLSGRKRNANGAVVMGPRVSQGVRVGSNLAAHSPIAAPSSSPYQARNMAVGTLDDYDDLEEDDCDMGRRSVETSRGSEPGLTDSSSVASSLASSRDSCNSLSSSTSQKFHARRLSEFAASTGSESSSASIFTPQNYKHVRPLQAAFMSTGLMSKKVRPRDSGVGVDSPAPKPQAPPLPAEFQVPPQPLMNPLLARAKQMPDTPCKRSPAPALLKSQPASNLSVPTVDNDGRLAMTLPPEEGPRAESPPDNSPTGPGLFSEHKKFGLRKAVPPLFRRRSSGQLAIEAGSANVHASGGSSSSGTSYDYEPMTPTRGAHEGFQIDGPQLVTTPSAPSPPKALPAAPVLSITTPTTQTFPTALNTCPRPPAHFYPPTAGRPQFRHRHSGSVLHSIRQQQLSLPDRFETNFSITRCIGRGVSSEAFAVVNRDSGAVSAVKRTKTPSTGPKDRLRRLEEIDILRQISTNQDKSPYIVSLFSAWEQEGHLYIETELCGRGNLAEFLDAHGQVHEFLDEARVWKITTQIALGIQHLHDRNILHLDLKPANIFVSEDGNLKLGDFGLATRWPRTSAVAILRGAAMDEADNLDGKAVPGVWPTAAPPTSESTDLEREGDREYIAPEVLSGRYGKEADLFSFGLVILEAAANVVLPDNGLSWHRLRSNDFSEVSTTRLSTPLSSLLVGLLAQDPQSRSTIGKVAEHPIITYLAEEYAHRRLLSEGADVSMEESLTDLVTGAIEPQADADDFLAQLLAYYEGCRRTNDYMALD